MPSGGPPLEGRKRRESGPWMLAVARSLCMVRTVLGAVSCAAVGCIDCAPDASCGIKICNI